jgi:hypothetical protein
MFVMAKKSSDEELLKKIHRILDDPETSSQNKKDDYYLSSLQRRISNNHQHDFKHLTKPTSSDGNLTPRVVIRKRQESVQKEVKEKKVKQETVSVGDEETYTISASQGVTVSDNELYEIEKPFLETEEIPEFIEVTSEEQEEETFEPPAEEEPLTITIRSETDENDESLPEWEAVDEHKQIEDSFEGKDTVFVEDKEKTQVFEEENEPEETNVSEFKQIKDKKPEIWEPLDSEKKKKPSLKKRFSHFKKSSKPPKKKKSKKEPSVESFVETDSEGNNEKVTENVENDVTEEKKSKKDGFQYGDYTLYQKTITINDEEKRTIHFFAKDAPETGKPTDLPSDYEVKINRKTGVPYIKKKQK